MSVTGLRLKYTGLCIVYIPLWHVPFMMQSCAMSMEVEDSEDRSQVSPEIWKMVNYSTKRWQDNGDRRQLARQHQSNLLCSLTRERDRWSGSRLDRTSSFWPLWTFLMLGVRHDAHAYIPSKFNNLYLLLDLLGRCTPNSSIFYLPHPNSWRGKRQNLELPSSSWSGLGMRLT